VEDDDDDIKMSPPLVKAKMLLLDFGVGDDR